jgi:predicted small lipoprotein YifL
MRRILASLLAVLALSLSLGACGTPSEESPSDQKNAGKSSATLIQPQ